MQYFDLKCTKSEPIRIGFDTSKFSSSFVRQYLDNLDSTAPRQQVIDHNNKAKEDLWQIRKEKGLEIDFRGIKEQYAQLAQILAKKVYKLKIEKRQSRSSLEEIPISNSKSKSKNDTAKEAEAINAQVTAKETKALNAQVTAKETKTLNAQDSAKETKTLNAQDTAKETKTLNAQEAAKETKTLSLKEPTTVVVKEEMSGNQNQNQNQNDAPKLSSYLKSLPKYDESYRDFHSYLRKFEKFFDISEITADKDKIKLVEYAVMGVQSKETLVEVCVKDHPDKWDDFKKKCLETIDGTTLLSKADIIKKMLDLKIHDFKDVKSYYAKFIELKGAGGSSVVVDDDIIMMAFIDGLPKNIKQILKSADHKTLFENYQAAERMWEKNNSENVVVGAMGYNNNNSSSRQPFRQRNGQGFGSRNNSRQNGGYRNNNNNNNNRNNRNGRNDNSGSANDQFNGNCHFCGEFGHPKNRCDDHKEFMRLKKAGKLGKRTRVGEVRFEHEDVLEDMASLTIDDRSVGAGHAFRGLNGSPKHTRTLVKSESAKSSYSHKTPIDKSEFLKSNDTQKVLSEPSNNLISNKLPVKTPSGASSCNIHVKNYYVDFSKSVKKKLFLTDSKNTHIKNIPWFPKVDSGAERSVLSLDVAKFMNLDICTKFNFRVITFDGEQSSKVVGFVERLHFKIPGTSESFTFSPIIIDSPDANLLGMDIIDTAGGGSFVPKNGENGLRWIFLSEQRKDPPSENIKLRALHKAEIEPGDTVKIKVEKFNVSGLTTVEPTGKQSNLKIYEGLIDDTCKEVYVRNLGTTKINVHKQQHIGNINPDIQLIDMKKLGETPYKVGKIDEKAKAEFAVNAREKVKHLPRDIQDRVYDVLMRHFSVFDQGSGQAVGRYPEPVSINPINKTVQVKPEKRRPYNPNVWSKINIELDKLESMDLVEDCDNVLTHPANLVCAKRKGSDRIRLCVDYRRLNEEIPDNNFPLPTKDELLSKLGNFDDDAVFIKIDVSNMFWNFELTPKDRHLTSFYTEHGVMQFKRLPFGVKSAPGTVQKALSSKVHSDFGLDPSSVTSLFIDDNLYGIRNSEIAIRDLDRILTLYGHLNLKLKLAKCDFLVKSTEFMGQKLNVSKNGVEVTANPVNVKAIQDLDTPNKSEKSLRGFIGMVSWISEFLPEVQMSLGPFHNLLSKVKKENGKLKNLWTEDYDRLFKEILAKVGNPKTLGIPDYKKGFMLEIDSSSAGHGACLYQSDRIIAYASKALQKHAVEYENAHRETAGVVWAIEKFSKFFSCSPFPVKIFTDNRVTQFIKTAKSPKLRRWKSYLDSFPNLELIHRAGPDMKVSDCLSRLVKEPKSNYTRDVTDELLEEVVIASNNIDSSQLEDFQIHLKFGHCGVDKLKTITGKSREYCKQIYNACFSCQTKTKVTEIRQLLGTIPDSKRKNSMWSIDFVFFPDKTGRKRTYLSILDRSTRFFIVSLVDSRHHAGVKTALLRDFSRMGKPEVLVADREMVSEDLACFFLENGIDFKPVARESPFLNPVERYHRECKKIALRCSGTMEEAANMLNYLPFSTVPANLKVKNICPATLFYSNNTRLVEEVCTFLEQESKRRQTRSEKLRGRNITRFQRIFQVGDLVKFNLIDKVGFGKVTERVGSKMYKINRIDGSNRTHMIHAQQLEKLLISEYFLKQMLKQD